MQIHSYDYRFEQTTGQHGEFMADRIESALEWLWEDAVADRPASQ